MKIGELAQQTGVSVDALRFYEEKGLLTPIGRTESGYRLYAPATVAQVKFIKSAQTLGFSLQEILDVMPALNQGNLRLDELRLRMREKLSSLDDQIDRLQKLRAEVLGTLDMFRCDGSAMLTPKELNKPT
jgi:MerR family copper efflux transcriptional regulator